MGRESSHRGSARPTDQKFAPAQPVPPLNGATTSPQMATTVEAVRLSKLAAGVARETVHSAVLACLICTGTRIFRGDMGLDAAMDVLKTGAKATLHSGTVNIVKAALENGLGNYALELAVKETANQTIKESAKVLVKESVKVTGKVFVKEGAKQVVKETGKRVVKEVGKQALQQTAKQAALTAARGNAIGAMAGLIVDQGVDTFGIFTGRIDGVEYAKRSAENTAGAVGGLGGAVAGSALGTAIFPGVGTVIGGILGGMGGSMGLSCGVKKLFR